MWMSSIGNVSAGSLFAVLQSAGAIGAAGVLLSPAAIAVESATFVSVVYGMNRNSIDMSNITGVVSGHLRSTQQRLADYTREYLANHPDVAEKIHLYTQSAQAHMSLCFSSIFKQETMDAISKHSKEAIKVIDEHTRVHRENLMKNISSFLSNMKSQETADLVRKHTEEGVEKARIYTENAINAANSYLSNVNTQEHIEFINKESQEAFHALDEQTRIHRENLIRNANSYFAGLFRQANSEQRRSSHSMSYFKTIMYIIHCNHVSLCCWYGSAHFIHPLRI